MMRRLLVSSVVCVFALAAGCSRQSASPAGPTSGGRLAADAGPDGSTLKATAPTPQSPVNNQKLAQSVPVTLIVGNATTPYTTGVPLSYRFEVYNAAGARVYASPLVASGSTTTSHQVTATLEGDQTYAWQARAEYNGTFGPFSTRASFVAPASDGYIRATELYDPLTNGKTVGTVGGSGNITWVPGQGIRMNDSFAYVVYNMPQTYSSGEMSVEVTGLAPGGQPGKARIFSMLDRLGAIASSAKYSFNLQYRGAGGAPDNCITWKAVLSDNNNSVEPVVDRFQMIYNLDPSKVYLWQAFWTPTSFRVVVKEGGATGPVLYDEKTDATSGTTNWNPDKMYAFIGTNNGAFVTNDGTRVGMTVRNLWVGNTPRPPTLP